MFQFRENNDTETNKENIFQRLMLIIILGLVYSLLCPKLTVYNAGQLISSEIVLYIFVNFFFLQENVGGRTAN